MLLAVSMYTECTKDSFAGTVMFTFFAFLLPNFTDDKIRTLLTNTAVSKSLK